MHKYYCQFDGGQWNVPVEVVDTSTRGWAIIKGKELQGTFTDIDGYGYLIIGVGQDFDEPQPTK